MKELHKRVILLSFLMFAMSLQTSVAGKLYKIVDENGNVTFSQFPPTPSEKSDKVVVEETALKTHATTVRRKGEALYCGKIQLPKKRERKEYYYSEIANRIKYWEKDLERKEDRHRSAQERYLRQAQHRTKYGSSSSSYQSKRYQESNKELLGSIRDLKCALSWGKKQQEESQSAKEEMNTELTRLQNVLLKLQDKQTLDCGQEPIYDPTMQGNKQDRQYWKKCNRKYQSDIRKLENLIRKESRKLERF